MSEFETLVERLAEASFEFVLVGGLRRSRVPRVTFDVDICAPLTGENLHRLLEALRGSHVRFRSFPPKLLPARAENLIGFRDLYREIDLGELGVLGEIAGIGPYDSVAAQSVEIPFLGRTLPVLSLDVELIHL